MIKIPKKQLHKTNPTNTAKSLRIITYIFLFLVGYIFLPILTIYSQRHPFKLLSLFYLVNILIILYLVHKNSQRKYRLELESQDIQEKVNLLNDEFAKELKNKISLHAKIERYDSLKKIVEEINRNLTLESITEDLALITFSLIANSKGTCILYLVDNQTKTNLNLFKTKKEDKQLVIKAKEGDIFDLWVLRHASPLLIEDTKKDFRFDLEKLMPQDIRPISSLISAPFISEHRFLGILRIDNPVPNFFSQDDLRFLVTICDLGALAIENAELFQKTQDLAIHDELTSFYTKGYFLERLREECKRSLRHKTTLSLLMLDIDYFKNYNDKFGHTAGDIVLRELSDAIIEFFKNTNPIISRFGGEEICIILPTTDKQKAYNAAENLRLKIEMTKIILRRQETNITVSIGLATFPEDALDADELIFKADKVMYEAKQKGRNRVCGV